MSAPSPAASTLELLTYIQAKLEALQRELDESSGAAKDDSRRAEFRLLGELARRLFPRDNEEGDADFMQIMRKREAIANLLAQQARR
ncbi:hypothetical protein ACT2FY_01390 [Paraburkholderia fungorum]|uniref:hypothetical protein n=1 Tax=Paraburkholderia fungorum TaxID=134537 RepID=UPI00402B4C4C